MARPLTRREQEVAKLVACGLTNVQIARRLGTSRYTVMRQFANICDKLNIHAPEDDPERRAYKRLRLAIALNVEDLTAENEKLRKRLSRYEASQ